VCIACKGKRVKRLPYHLETVCVCVLIKNCVKCVVSGCLLHAYEVHGSRQTKMAALGFSWCWVAAREFSVCAFNSNSAGCVLAPCSVHATFHAVMQWCTQQTSQRLHSVVLHDCSSDCQSAAAKAAAGVRMTGQQCCKQFSVQGTQAPAGAAAAAAVVVSGESGSASLV
jgi:hypothetical protein